jgi:hypothetical protein
MTPGPGSLPVAGLPAVAPVKIKRKGAKLRFAFKGTVTVPPPLACGGPLNVAIKNGKRTVSTARLVLKTCAFGKTLTIKRAKLKKAKRVTVTLTLPSTATLTGATKTYTVKLPR